MTETAVRWRGLAVSAGADSPSLLSEVVQGRLMRGIRATAERQTFVLQPEDTAAHASRAQEAY